MESTIDMIIIYYMGSTAMQKLLKYMYSGWIDLCGCEAEVISELVIAAEKVGNDLSQI
jgi:hypothetical protein